MCVVLCTLYTVRAFLVRKLDLEIFSTMILAMIYLSEICTYSNQTGKMST